MQIWGASNSLFSTESNSYTAELQQANCNGPIKKIQQVARFVVYWVLYLLLALSLFKQFYYHFLPCNFVSCCFVLIFDFDF